MTESEVKEEVPEVEVPHEQESIQEYIDRQAEAAKQSEAVPEQPYDGVMAQAMDEVNKNIAGDESLAPGHPSHIDLNSAK